MSIPLVKGFRDGAAVAEFVGLQPPPAIEAFLDRLVPSEVDRLVAEGDEDSLRQAIEREPGHVGARVALARLLLGDGGRADEAAAVLEPVRFDQGAAALLSRLKLASVDQPDVEAGLAALDRGQTEQGLGHLIDAVRVADPELRDDLRQALLGVFAELGEHHPLSVRFRRRLAQALY
jgi:putative thioredoxin